MKGQWIGNYTGSSPGMIIVNVDERSTHYQGVAYLHESNPAIPSTAASFKTSKKERSFRFRTDVILPINVRRLNGDNHFERRHGFAHATL